MGKILATIQIRDRGVVTIPKEVREYLNIKIGDELSLTYEGGKVLMRKAKTIHEDFKVKD